MPEPEFLFDDLSNENLNFDEDNQESKQRRQTNKNFDETTTTSSRDSKSVDNQTSTHKSSLQQQSNQLSEMYEFIDLY